MIDKINQTTTVDKYFRHSARYAPRRLEKDKKNACHLRVDGSCPIQIAEMNERLRNISDIPAKDRPRMLRSMLESIVSSKTVADDCRIYLAHICSEEHGLVMCRQLIHEFTELFANWSTDKDPALVMAVWRDALESTSTKSVAFESEISAIREHLAAIMQDQEDWAGAAQVLQGIPLDSGHRTVPNDYKVRIYIHIVQLLLEDNNSVSAEAYLNRAALIMHLVEDPVMHLKFQGCQARALDFRRAFLQAAGKYYELSNRSELGEMEQVNCLAQACTCAILAGAGPMRSRILATLYKDPRVHTSPQLLTSGIASMLEKMRLGQVCRQSEAEAFRAQLKPHQDALLAGSQTILDRALVEHNLLSASKLYANVDIGELGHLLGISAERAEGVASHMISENRLQASIDQVSGLIFFSSQAIVPEWTDQIARLCGKVNHLVNEIKQKYPQLT